MKHLIIYIWLSLVFISCENSKTNTTEKTEASIKGVWELTTKYFYENDIITDSVIVTSKNRHVKVFTVSKYMWTNMPTDSIDWHAYGTYDFDGKKLVEHKEYSSLSMSTHSGSATCEIIIGDNSYTQIFIDSIKAPYYAEKYKRIE